MIACGCGHAALAVFGVIGLIGLAGLMWWASSRIVKQLAKQRAKK